MDKIKELHEHFLKSNGVCIDTRKITDGVIFFALKGNSFDGNTFALKALEMGAMLSVVDDKNISGDNIFFVDDVLIALQELAKYHRNTFDIPVIGLTGSNGKTTTKELLTKVLEKKYTITSTAGNYNNHIGVPLTLLNLTDKTQIAIVEMGANHVGEIAFLCEMARPTHGLITNIGKAHLEGFGGIEGVKKGKGELYDFLRLNDGVLFVNYSSATLVSMSKGIKTVVPYLDNDKYQLITSSSEEEIIIKHQSGYIIRTHLVGDYNFNNAVAAMCVGEYFGLESSAINNAIAEYIPDNNRSQVILTGKNKVLLDAYNANPTSIESALKSFSIGKKEDKVVVLGDMFELGEYSQLEHNKVVELISELGFIDALLCGKEFQKVKGEYPSVSFFSNKSDLEDYLKRSPIEGKHILIKGSRGIGLETILPYL